MTLSRRAFAVAVLVAIVTSSVCLVNTRGWALANGDESIYAQAAREMLTTRRFDILRWQGIDIYSRPPGAALVLVVARLFLAGELAVRVPLAMLCGIEAGLVVLLGTLLYRLSVGVLAAGVLVTSDLFLRYARYYESEPLLCIGVLVALIGYEVARRRQIGALVYAIGFFIALGTKQIVGLLPLAPLLLDVVSRRPVPLRRMLFAVGAAGIAIGIWYALMIARYGRQFIDVHVFANVVARSQAAQLRRTTSLFYVENLVAEGLTGALFALAVIGAIIIAWREHKSKRGSERPRAAMLLLGWSLGVLALFSIAHSRYDYYLLLAYPAWSLLAAALLLDYVPLRSSVRAILVAATLITTALTHLPPRLDKLFGDIEIRALVQSGFDHVHAPELLIIEQLPYSARYYAPPDVRLTMLLRNARDYEDARWQEANGMPTVPELAPDLAVAVRAHGPALVIVPKPLVPALYALPLVPLGTSPTYSMFAWRGAAQ